MWRCQPPQMPPASAPCESSPHCNSLLGPERPCSAAGGATEWHKGWAWGTAGHGGVLGRGIVLCFTHLRVSGCRASHWAMGRMGLCSARVHAALLLCSARVHAALLSPCSNVFNCFDFSAILVLPRSSSGHPFCNPWTGPPSHHITSLDRPSMGSSTKAHSMLGPAADAVTRAQHGSQGKPCEGEHLQSVPWP